MTYAKQVRLKYGDSVEEFALRLNTLTATVESWEEGKDPQPIARELLKYADKYQMTIYPRISEEFTKLSVSEQVKLLMDNFGDTQRSFSERLGIEEHTVGRWIRSDIMSPIAKRYIYEVAAYPERFQTTLKSYKE